MGHPQSLVQRRKRVRAHDPGQPATNRNGLSPVAGGPQAAAARPRRHRRLHDQPASPPPPLKTMKLEPAFLRGSYTPVVTPFRAGKVDYEQFASLIERQVKGGTHGVVVAGSSGEATRLS